ncbi:DUF2878 domain-containing protein [Microbulbifer elongatus]|uniref:DUF2878 domain-containing protein n=1 Tax=Microbulbifer elongatus TaxID=86173 RepID=UPI001CFEE144|nr:DUF2878 family protein [Microbulbifer elongatus]
MESNCQVQSVGVGKLLISGLLFEVIWLLCVLAPGPALLAGITLGNLALHLWLFSGNPLDLEKVKRTLSWVALVTVFGCWMDAALFRIGVFHANHDVFLLPSWLMFLWVNFALALRFAFRFLHRNLILAAAVGALAGPFSYWIGARINGSVVLAEPVTHTGLLLAGLWGLFLPLLLVCARMRFFRP